ncbi:protein kinase, putative [Bodo saltans]|uniref:Protein kinase, putative n=1 Tax=Bodo saltans TaxID=75058 RepID=A0A0S4JUY0_BODSA|nr:protein kinase, putative [Bodo saltans]|eukprot:CUG92377.1 protein kinase, putative [Bodo saltans]
MLCDSFLFFLKDFKKQRKNKRPEKSKKVRTYRVSLLFEHRHIHPHHIMAASQGQHAQVLPGMMVQNRYVVIKEIGSGNFSKVYTCKDTKAPTYCAARPEDTPTLALKVLKKEYANDAAFERDMLKALASKDTHGTANVSTMLDVFTWNRHPCFVMPLKGPTLRSRKFGIAKGHVSRTDMSRLARCLLRSLKFIHFDCKMVHTDLKPENILLNTDAPHIGDAWTICDFGSASHWRTDKMDSDLISTRPYRAPEVVLGNPWSYPADMWSLGCILFEAAVGVRLFEVHDDNTHLHLMTSRIGSLPEVYTRRSKHSKKFFDGQGSFLRPSGVPAASTCTATGKAIREVLKDEPLLADLLHSMLHFDPAKRIRADAALEHPFFESPTHAPASSCGTSSAPSVCTTATSTPRELSATSIVDAVKKAHPPSASSSTSQRSASASSIEPTLVPITKAPAVVDSNIHSSKFRALPPLMSAFQALGVTEGSTSPIPFAAKENGGSTAIQGVPQKRVSPSSAAAQRPLQNKCRTPEELRKAPLSAHVGGGAAAARQLSFGAPRVGITTKLSFSGMPRSSSISSTAARMPTVALPAGKASGMKYYAGN